MSRLISAALLATAAALAAPAVAFADCAPTTGGTPPPCVAGRSSEIANTQVALDPTFGHLNLQVEDAPSVAGAATAAANTVGVTSQGRGVRLATTQSAHAEVAAATTATVWGADQLLTSANATGNGLTAAVDGAPMRITSLQTVGAGPIRATYTSSTRALGEAATSASAGANVAAVSARNGDLTTTLTQISGATVRARAEDDHCCVGGTATTSSQAAANSVAVTGETTTNLVRTDQRSTGAEVTALADLYAGTAENLAAGAAASGNSLMVGNVWGYADVHGLQTNQSAIRAEAYTTVGESVRGVTTASSYGVGNSVVAQNASSDLRMDVSQLNSGGVTSSAALSGIGAMGGQAGATAIGNLVGGHLCSVCGGGLITANTSQTSSGQIGAYTTVIGPRAGGPVIGSATAIGNAATFTVTDGRP